MAGNVSAPTSGLQTSGTGNYRVPLVILTSLFFMWGFITCMNDILIPHLMNVFELSYTEGMLVQFVFFTAYAVMSLPSGSLVSKIGYKKGIVIGLIVAAIGAMLFYPAAGIRSYPFFLFAFFVLASGITLLQVSANPYVSILGPSETASSRLNLTQAFNSLGTTIAGPIGSMLILAVATTGVVDITTLNVEELSVYRAAEAATVQSPYLALGATLLILAAIIAMVKLPVIISSDEDHKPEAAKSEVETKHSSAWQYPHLVLGAIGIFVYVGAEVSIGSFLVKFFGLPEIAGMDEAAGGSMIAYYWGGAMVGRFIGAAIMQKMNPGKILAFNGLMSVVLVLLTMLLSGHIAMYAILAVGFFNSIMFPTIFTLAINKLGVHTAQGSGILCMAIVGGAIIPLAQGFFADSSIGLHHSFILPVLCYAYIAYYGWKGHKVQELDAV
ncbi:MAG: L-fucose:H+ symporter permease [Salinivirgaceae bacterium]|jgi:FHS family L-fucose permease-like MFS transporter|nr:L-fucose:H+ symporter permease [Salinivirgaceae bacterium]